MEFKNQMVCEQCPTLRPNKVESKIKWEGKTYNVCAPCHDEIAELREQPE